MELTRRNVVKLGFGTAMASALWPRLKLFAQAAAVTKAIPSNRPARNVLAKLGKTPLPDWAGELGCKTWAQFFLKYIVSHPNVTCTIPGTRSVAHLVDNMEAMREPMPDAAMRRRMEEYIEKA